MPELREHNGQVFAAQYCYSVPDSAWHIDLSEVEPVAEPWATLSSMPALPGPSFILAVVPDEDPSAQPTIHLFGGVDRAVPYEVMQWFMQKVTEEVEGHRQ